MKNENWQLELKKELVNQALPYSAQRPSSQVVPITDPETGILFLSTYPPRECGIATYTQDLVKALKNKFNHSFKLSLCALESDNEKHSYGEEVKFLLDTDQPDGFTHTARAINADPHVSIVVIQHEFGLFSKNEKDLQDLITLINKPVIIAFHTVLPNANEQFRSNVQKLASLSTSLIVMTRNSANILIDEYGIPSEKINVIPHGTHLVPHTSKEVLKSKYGLAGRKVLSTFGLLSSGKNIEMTLASLPLIVQEHPDVTFLIIGKTHPSVVKSEGEIYRTKLEVMVKDLQLSFHVKFINYFLPLPELLEYLQLTDIYLFTSKDLNQAVSGTFSYALSSGCAIISTPIPHAKEVLKCGAGMIVELNDPAQFIKTVCRLLEDDPLRKAISSNALHIMASTAWENSAIAHALLFETTDPQHITLDYSIPVIKLDHIKNLTTDFGMIQFSKYNHPDLSSGYTLDDNARALVASCQYYEMTSSEHDLTLITIYLNFIEHCLAPGGHLLNYVNEEKQFTEQNTNENLEDSNGRAIWALGYLLSVNRKLPEELIGRAEALIKKMLVNVNKIHSTRAMAFIMKGLYYRNINKRSVRGMSLIRQLANRLINMYKHETSDNWQWFEGYLTYGNSVLPEALLCAWLATGDTEYRDIAKTSFDFLLSKTFIDGSLHVIPNQSWLKKGEILEEIYTGGEQPIDVAYTILALSKFHDVFEEGDYLIKMKASFSWFLGNNHLHRIIYNPCTGGCYDGLEKEYVNLNQGAESTVSYLLARLTVEKYSNLPAYNNNSKKETALLPLATNLWQ